MIMHFSSSSIFTMDSSDNSLGRSPRRELQGPRPAPLRVHKDSHKIKKPPLVPPPQQPSQPHAQQPRLPVIIYTVSPKIIHTKPSDFMNLVQRLTGLSASSSSSSSSSNAPASNPVKDNRSGAISPAARYATIEKARSPEGKKQQSGEISGMEGLEMAQGVEVVGSFPGILSPGPASLRPIPPNFFSPPSDPSMFSFFHDLSPMIHGNRNFIEGSFMLSPSTFFSPRITSPTPSIDLFNNFFDC